MGKKELKSRMENLKMENVMDKVIIVGHMEIGIKVNLKIVKEMDKELTIGLMVINI